MLKLDVVGSNSFGNCYFLSSKTETLMIDCGVTMSQIKEALDFDLKKVVGAVITHCHKDHSASEMAVLKSGIKVFAPYHSGAIDRTGDRVKFGNFIITCFDLPHDEIKNYGFLIDYKGHKLLYMTDFEYCRYNFKSFGISNIIIECNYQPSLLTVGGAHYEHKVKGHCSSDTCKRFLQANKTDSLMSVVLCHLGEATTDKYSLINEVKNTVGCDVFIAEKGREFELYKDCPF